MFFLNTAITQLTNFGILILVATTESLEEREERERGYYATIGDITFIFNCMIDPLIYVVWFKEVRLGILNMLKVVFPCLYPTAHKMRVEVGG